MQVQVLKFPIFIFLCLNFQHIKSFRFVHVQEQNVQWWLENHNKKLTNLPLIIMLFRHHKWLCASNNLPIPCYVPQHYIYRSIYWNGIFPTKQTWRTNRLSFIENKTQKDFISSCKRLVPFCRCQIDGIIGLLTTLLHFMPPLMINFIYIELELVKLQGCICELKG